jgi:hypothetical protein
MLIILITDGSIILILLYNFFVHDRIHSNKLLDINTPD